MKLLNKILAAGYCFLFVGPVVACTSQEIAQAQSYADQVTNACTVASTLASAASVAVPAVATAAVLVNASCGTIEAVNKLILSPTSVAWLNTLITTIKSKGAVVPPAPIENP